MGSLMGAPTSTLNPPHNQKNLPTRVRFFTMIWKSSFEVGSTSNTYQTLKQTWNDQVQDEEKWASTTMVSSFRFLIFYQY